MPSIKRRLCPKHGIYTTNRCEQCHKQTAKVYNEQSRSKESTAVYNTRRWRKLRAQQLSASPLCINFDICGNVATIADHIVEISDGGEPFSLNNTQSMCIGCHNTKTSQVKREREGKDVSFKL